MEKENILFWRRRKTEEIIREGQIICLEEREKEENIWKKENKLEEKKTEKEKEENVWRREKHFFCGGDEERRWKRRQISWRRKNCCGLVDY